MLDAAFIRDNIDAVKANCLNRNVDPVPVDRAVKFDDERKRLVQLRSETAAKQNALSKQFGSAKTPEEKDALRKESTELKDELGRIDAQIKIVEDDLRYNLLLIPNMSHPAAPVGKDASANKATQLLPTPPPPRRWRRGGQGVRSASCATPPERPSPRPAP